VLPEACRVDYAKTLKERIAQLIEIAERDKFLKAVRLEIVSVNGDWCWTESWDLKEAPREVSDAKVSD